MKEKEERTNTFSKSIMSIMMFLYFMGAALGTILVILAAVINVRNGDPIDTQMFIAYAAYVGGPTATAIGFYAWKSKAENLLKIQQSHEVIETLSQMGGN
jgi:hypothetical protein